MNEPFIIFGQPLIGKEEMDEVMAVLESGWLGTGPRVHRFEKRFASYKGVSQAVAVNSCTAALHLSLLVSDLKPGDEVITTPMTFCATVNAIIHAGGKPVLADINADDLNISVAEVERQITKRTRAIVPVHFAGIPCDMDPLIDLAKKHDLNIIEDCAHAIESEYKGKKMGTLGDFGCFSFYVTKNVITGEGGMILGRDKDHLKRIRRLSLHGLSRDAWNRFNKDGNEHYQVLEAGFKYNMTDLQAAIGLHQLNRVNRGLQRRNEIWKQYNQAFEKLSIQLPAEVPEGSVHGRHLYTLQVKHRQRFIKAMKKKGIGIGIHYLSIAEHPFYQDRFGWKAADYPMAMKTGRDIISLPLTPKLTEDEVERVIKAVRKNRSLI
ncbi:DegT/DnrJ/EryC1/StrS family aminotransferase [Magnetococcales bacterium HHB-1]